MALTGPGVGIYLLPMVHLATRSQAHTGCWKSDLPLRPRKLQNDLEFAVHCHTNSAFIVSYKTPYTVTRIFLHCFSNSIREIVFEEAILVAFTSIWVAMISRS